MEKAHWKDFYAYHNSWAWERKRGYVWNVHLGLVDARPFHRLGKHARVAGCHGLHAPLLPLEELAVLDEAVLDHLRDPRCLEVQAKTRFIWTAETRKKSDGVER